MTHRMSAHHSCFLPVLILANIGQLAAAAPPPEKLFPTSTTEFVSIKDPARLGATWQQTQLAQLLHDPATRPFIDELSQHTNGFNLLLDVIGIDFNAIKQAGAGEIAWGVILANPNQVAHAMTINFSGRANALNQLWTTITKQLASRNVAFEQQRQLSGNLTVYPARYPNGRQVIFGSKDGLLLICDD
jgi:hypothetical protein